MHKMGSLYVFVLSIFIISGEAEATECEDGWTAHKDQQCVKIFPTNLLTYEEARVYCSLQGSELSKASLVMIKDEELQEFLANYTSDVFEFLWLGGKYDEETAQFRWDDGEPLTYTNWLEGHPRNDSSSDLCIEFRPQNARVSTSGADGKWAAVVCQKRNLVMCQKDSTWTLQDALGQLINLRKELESTKQNLQQDLQSTKQELQSTKQILQSAIQDHQDTKQELQRTKQDILAVDSRVVPVGSIYIEYFNQPSPTALWPNLAWQDITSTYAGLFFRASGAGSGDWGDTQAECAPRITQMQLAYFTPPTILSNPTIIPASGWSIYGFGGNWWTGAPYEQLYYEGLRFHTESCDVRPKNQAFKIWKRTA